MHNVTEPLPSRLHNQLDARTELLELWRREGLEIDGLHLQIFDRMSDSTKWQLIAAIRSENASATKSAPNTQTASERD